MNLLTTVQEDRKPLIESTHYVEGYATTFEKYKLYEDYDGTLVYEQFTKENFINCDMSDIIFQFNHRGMVYARQKNGSLIVKIDDHGLFIAADLSRTAAAREIYDAIKCGNIDRMSWGFVPFGESFDTATRTITYKGIKKIYDVSAVDLPANEDTEIAARTFVDGEIKRVQQELLRRKKAKLALKLKIMKG